MTYERFQAIVEAYGAAPKRWPEAEREGAEAFARADGRAAALLGEAAALDRALDLGRQEADATLSAARALRGYHRRSAMQSLTSPTSRSFWALAASAVIGVVLGVGAGSVTPAAADDAEQVLTTAFEAPLEFTGEDFGG